MKASLKTRYDLDKNAGAATVGFGVGDVKLRATLTDATVVKGPSMNGLALAVEKPGFFIVDYNVPKKDFRFQFMSSVKVLQKPLNLTYIHGVGDNRTIVDGTLVIDSANKVAVNHMLGSSKNGKVKYTYVHKGLTTFEPSYDLGKNTWDFAMARKVYDDDVVRATYQPSSKTLGLEWSRNSKTNGVFKITAAFDLANELKTPKVVAESTWNIDL
uniref:Uncharacterized protein n=1 Tax=Kalanchoe fedtschenkoi TaxID=63787 RepID=A0A7N0TQL0_KALFE